MIKKDIAFTTFPYGQSGITHTSAMFRLQEASVVGPFSRIYFKTEPHYRNKSNSVGMMTFNCIHTAQNMAPETVLVKCMDVHPTLRATISLDTQQASHHMADMKQFLNQQISAAYSGNTLNKITGLADNRYVLDAAIDKSPPPVSQDNWTKKTESTGVQTHLKITFSRTEDADHLMKGCRAFFKKIKRGSQDIQIKFPPPAYPMWVRLHEDISDSVLYKRYRDVFHDWEVCDDFCTENGWYYSSHFYVPDSSIQFTAKTCNNGVWSKVLYVNFSDLSVCHTDCNFYVKGT